MALAALFLTFAIFGLVLVALDFAAKVNSPAPSMYRSGMTMLGWTIFISWGLIALAAFISFWCRYDS